MSYQAGEVGSKFDEASSVIHDHGGDMDKLANGANQLADALAQVRGQVNGAVGSVSTPVTALSAMEAAMGGDKTLNQLDQTTKLVGRMRALGDALSANMADVANTAAWATPMLTALNASPVCSTDPLALVRGPNYRGWSPHSPTGPSTASLIWHVTCSRREICQRSTLLSVDCSNHSTKLLPP